MFEQMIERLNQTVHIVTTRREQALALERHGERTGRGERETELAKRLSALEGQAQ